MPAQHGSKPGPTGDTRGPSKAAKKRKDPPTDAASNQHDRPKGGKRARKDHRPARRDARALSAQTSSQAFRHGELDVAAFVRAREYEIRALEAGLVRSKKALATRAFQQVPKELRRRTASHNAKAVPKRLQQRAKAEMAVDNTPTVSARRRKPSRHMRLRLETARKLRALGAAQRRASQKKAGGAKVGVQPPSPAPEEQPLPLPLPLPVADVAGVAIQTRAPKIKKARLAAAPTPKARFRKRQLNKTWLPTHLFHAKRARMTPPQAPMWRFAVPLTPTAKCYRPTHRAAHHRGAVAWDVSYMSTIGIEGQQRGIEGVLRALRVDDALWTCTGEKWRNGSRVWEGFVFEREPPHRPIAPVAVIWSPSPPTTSAEPLDRSKEKRKLFVRVHPSAFLQLWEEVRRLSKVAKPHLSVEDLRYEIGSIDIAGPGSTEALSAALWPSAPSHSSAEHPAGSAQKTWTSLAGLPDVSLLPANVVLGFEIQDSRLHHPPRPVKRSATASDQMDLLELAAAWPPDSHPTPSSLFDRRARLTASSSLPSQKAINRRRSLAAPGQYPEALSTDPKIPVMVYSTSRGHRKQASWTVLLPWKAVQPVWYSIMYVPLSTGEQPRFGGLDEKRQLAFEAGQPWFPADFPGTKAGWEWEVEERRTREEAWRRRPKSKRLNWDAVQLGNGNKGEIGSGWACDWERLLRGPSPDVERERSAEVARDTDAASAVDGETNATNQERAPVRTIDPPNLTYLPAPQAATLLSSTSVDVANAIITVSLTCLSRGTPQHCARIYRLPSDPDLRQHWLALHPQTQPNKAKRSRLPHLPKDAPPHIVHRRLAQSLLEPARAGPDPSSSSYPTVPGEQDLIGFVTTGNLNLAAGKGTAVGGILFHRVARDLRDQADAGRICIVRNAGQRVGRLATWEMV